MRLASRPFLLIGSLVALAQGGCMMLAAGAIGGGAAAIGVSRGTVARTFDGSVEATATATQSALRDLGLPVERPRVGAQTAEIDSTLAGGEPVLFTLKAEPQPVPSDSPRTRVEVHIKIFGDRKLSERLLDQISHRLSNPALPPTQTTTVPPPPAAEQTEEPGLAAPTRRGGDEPALPARPDADPATRRVNATDRDEPPPAERPSPSGFVPPRP